MSNNQMVSVPRELLERAKQFTFDLLWPGKLRDDLQAVLAQPADQPLGWVYEGGQEFTSDPDRAHDLRAEGIELTAVYGLAQHQVEPAALPARKPEALSFYPTGWNACLDAIAKLGPLYTHPAPFQQGEVERLRAELEKSKANSKQLAELDDAFIKGQSIKLRAITAQLAEREALLADAANLAMFTLPEDWHTRYAALSASAEPSPPKCCAPTAQEEALLASGDYRPEELWGGPRPTCPKCIKPGPKSCGACANGCISGCQLEKDSPPSECQHRYMHFGDQDKRRCADCSKVEPSAPVERDERAEFEADQRSKGFAIDILPGTVATYMVPAVRFAWAGWQARAALERKP